MTDSKRLVRWQAASGLVFGVFLTLHLITTSSAMAGTYDGVLGALRRIYRPHIVVEVLLIGVSALVHVACGLLRWWERRQRGSGKPGWRVRLQRWTGYTLLVIYFGHVFATRVMPAGTADQSYLAYSLLTWPVFMIPYYVVFGVAGAIHLCLGVASAVQMLWPKRVKGTVARPIGGWVAVGLALAVAGGVAMLVRSAPHIDHARFPEYRALYQKYMPFMRAD
jgi:succinate dehydrogenase/fumarate reductase cytochrome b subunit